MSERRGTKALETWCRRLTEGYPGVKVENMTTSWRDGLAFCAIIHHFRPDLIDFSSLNKSDVYYNNSLAFRIAERHLGIPALLDAEDMVEYAVPDRLSILTYLSQFYQVFGNSTNSGTSANKQGSPARLVPKRSQDRGLISPSSTSPPTKMASRSSIGVTGSSLGRREPCAKCGNPVFLAERLNVGTKLYHRTCFRCARCNNQLSLANFYETETGQYCCETCPDEEVDNAKSETTNGKFSLNNSDSFLVKLNRLEQFKNRSLSDEEKQKGLQKFEDDSYSADFENAIEEPSSDRISHEESFFSKARSQFLSSHLLNEDQKDALVPDINMEASNEDETPPPLPKSKPPDDEPTSLSNIDLSVPDKSATTTDSSVNKLDLKDVSLSEIDTVNSANKNVDSSNQQNTASEAMLEENAPLREKNITKDSSRSLVKSRMLLFEANDKANTEPTSSISIIDDSKNEEIDFKTPKSVDKTRYISVSSEDINKRNLSEDYKSIRSDNSSDSVILISSVSDVNSPLDKNINTNETIDISSDSSVFTNSNHSKPQLDEDSSVCAIQDSSYDIELKNISDIPDTTDYSFKLETSSIKSNNSNEIIVNETEPVPIIEKEAIPEMTIDSSNKEETNEINKDSSVDSNINETSSSNLDNPIVEIVLPADKPVSKEVPLSHTILRDLSGDVSPVPIDPSLLESNSSISKEYPDDLNPFGDDEDDKNEIEEMKGIQNTRLLIKPSQEDLTMNTPENAKRNSTNPFGSSDEEEENKMEVKGKPPRPPPPNAAARNDERKVVKAPKISLNPFWSDDEDHEDEQAKPVPKPRTKNLGTPEPKPRKSGLSNAGDRYDSNSSLSSMSSSISHTPGRKKKPAPPPPPGQIENSLSPQNSKQTSPCTSAQHSPKTTPRIRKNRKAPLPPTSTPLVQQQVNSPNAANYSPITEFSDETNNKPDNNSEAADLQIVTPPGTLTPCEVEKEKISKDEKNRNRQSQNISSPVQSDSDSLSLSQNSTTGDKSMHGKWKRKKGPAPARPVPQRRQIRPLPLAELRRELDIIEMQQQGLEKQGVKLEQLIREKCEAPGACDETNLSPEVEELVLELFELVNEKNELFRRQAELMYLRRQQRLEEEYADIEYQIRCLMDRPEINKTDSDKAREEELINRLVEVVERRNEIIECLEMDRVREAEEDQSINTRLTEIATRREEEYQSKLESPIKLSKKEKKKIKKEKKLKDKGKTIDADKDIDESETSSIQEERKKKKKMWFLSK